MLTDVEQLKNRQQSHPTQVVYSHLAPVGFPADYRLPPEFIPESVIFDIEKFSQPDASCPHTLLNSTIFEKQLSDLGINNNSDVVVYDKVGIYSAPRAWFNMKLMGLEKVAILDGGLPEWQKAGEQTVVEAAEASTTGNFKAQPNLSMLASKEMILDSLSNTQVKVVDVRSSNRFYGREAEPRAGLRSGHMPNAINIPFAEFLDGNKYKDKHHLLSIFSQNGCTEDNTLIFSCGSGVTACIGYFAAHLCGFSQIKVYDGSWAEWGAISSLPIELD